MKPRHPHDCERCTFLGTFGSHDLYYCAKQPHLGPTVIARFGPEGDYNSKPVAFQDGNTPGWLPEHPDYDETAAALRVARLICIDAVTRLGSAPIDENVAAPFGPWHGRKPDL